jgi:peptidoglycan/LPS O-acetylase OafA/YrhL
VVLVLIYHFYPSLLPAGFLGVDVFFVFSGYLITALLLREFQTTGRIDLLSFYRRRIRRLLPALVFMVLVILPLSLLISPDFRVGITQQVAAVMGWVTNFFEIAGGRSYDDRLLPHLFTHTWTLSVEMQYYLIWGALLCVVLPSGLALRRLRADSRGMVALIAGGGVVLSFVAMQLLLVGVEDPSLAYYSTLSHLYPLLIGSAVGVLAGFAPGRLVSLVERIKPSVAIIITAACLLGITIMAALFTFETMLVYHLGILLTSLLVAVVIILGRGMQKRLARYPEPTLPLYLANTSYSLYLFHWPLFIIIGQGGQRLSYGAPAELAPLIGGGSILLALALTFVCAHLSYHLVEKPFSTSGRGLSQIREVLRARLPQIPSPVPLVLVSALLLMGCVQALWSAPAKTSIEQNYQQGSLVLDLTQLNAAHEAFDQVAQAGTANAESLATEMAVGDTDVSGESVYMPGAITIVGDSVTLDAADSIQAATGAYIDASIGRSMRQGVSTIEEMQSNGSLGEYVVIALATNTHADSLDAAREIVEGLEPGHRLIFVTAYGVGNEEMGELSAELRALSLEFSFITIADWNEAVTGKEDLLAPDGYHCAGSEAERIYTRVVLDAIREARLRPTT